jgi:chromosome segregation ATPase
MSKSRKINLVKVKNFQAHEESEFRLSNGLNLIYATNDSGKSALARALDFVLQNKSEGNDYIFRNAKVKVAEVEIVFNNGDVIRRKKGKDKTKDINCVEIKYADEADFKSWYAFGSTYPQEVIDFINLPPTSKALGPIHYADQYTKNFLIDRKPSEIPSIISSFIGVDDLELASSKLNAKVVRLDKSISGLRKSVEDLNNEIETTYGDLDENLSTYNKAKKLYDQADKYDSDLRKATNLYELIIQANNDGKKAKKDIEFYDKIIDHLSVEVPKLEELKTEYNDLITFNTKYENLLENIQTNNDDLLVNNEICSGDFKKLLDDSEDLLTQISEMRSHLKKIKDSYTLRNDNQTELTDNQTTIDSLEDEKKELYVMLKELEPMCKTCNKIGGVLVEEQYRN